MAIVTVDDLGDAYVECVHCGWVGSTFNIVNLGLEGSCPGCGERNPWIRIKRRSDLLTLDLNGPDAMKAVWELWND